ncbi:MAG: hypothetical protein Q7T86_03355 [Hyphomicrobiaceae bacterium]|nr:hypothetical protein [Hyphomicrobiaceae bacterium]
MADDGAKAAMADGYEQAKAEMDAAARAVRDAEDRYIKAERRMRRVSRDFWTDYSALAQQGEIE